MVIDAPRSPRSFSLHADDQKCGSPATCPSPDGLPFSLITYWPGSKPASSRKAEPRDHHPHTPERTGRRSMTNSGSIKPPPRFSSNQGNEAVAKLHFDLLDAEQVVHPLGVFVYTRFRVGAISRRLLFGGPALLDAKPAPDDEKNGAPEWPEWESGSPGIQAHEEEQPPPRSSKRWGKREAASPRRCPSCFSDAARVTMITGAVEMMRRAGIWETSPSPTVATV